MNDDELYGCLEYDLQAELQKDLAGFWRHEFSARKLIMWIRHLPSHSALAARGYAGDDRWGATEHLLASVADYVYMLDFHFLKSKNAKNLGEPEWMERPDMTLKL